MEQYFIEGLFYTRQASNHLNSTGKKIGSDVELFSRSFWADSPEEAIRMATEALDGGRWVEMPEVSKISEEKRMRDLGAPELPGFSKPKKKHKSK
jgi:hypothetical protein